MTRTYLAECYWPGVSEARLARAFERHSEEPYGDGAVNWLDSILIPEDEILLCVFEGPSAEAVRRAAVRSGLPAERIADCVRITSRANK